MRIFDDLGLPNHSSKIKMLCKQELHKFMDIETAYNHALDYLYSFVDFSLTRNFRNAADKFDLQRMELLMERLGNPQNQYKVIHVAGTKGKGSTAAFIESAIRAAGYRTGFYTSPHLEDYCERIQVNRENISHLELVDLIEEIKPVVAEIPQLTTFEITTALGFLYFAKKGVEVAVIEVGLGGRLDATNIVHPLVSVITSLSYDHMAVLGDTLAKIAFEKAGIIKPGRPVVVSPQTEEALEVVERVAGERNSPLTLVGRDFLYTADTHDLTGQSFSIWSNKAQAASSNNPDPQKYHYSIPLLGFHQVENAATAYAVLQIARQEGLDIPKAAVESGFSNVYWPGRFEILSMSPPLIVDSAHNRDSALKLHRTIEEYLGDKPVIILFGASEDKDIRGMFQELLPGVRKLIATQSVHPRALDAHLLAEMASEFGVKSQVVLPLEAALETALQEADSEAAVLACGSIFIAAAVREYWHKMKQRK